MIARCSSWPAWGRATTPNEVAARLREIRDVDVYTRDQYSWKTRLYWTWETGIGVGFGLTVFMAIVVGVVIVSQTIYSATIEHLREFGTLKAIGATNRDVYGIILKQALINALIGYAIGLAITLVAVRTLGATGMVLVIPFGLMAAVFVLTVAMCATASVVSVRKALQCRPPGRLPLVSTTLEADQLTKIYQEGAFQVPAVQDVTLTARSGEVVAIMGPSGSGKTTLLSMLGCMLRPTSGSITIHGECVSDLDETQLPWVRRRYVGFIFQSFNLFAALSAAENVEIVLQLKGLERRRGGVRRGVCSTSWGSTSGQTSCRETCREESASVYPSRGPSRAIPPHPRRRADRQPGREEWRTGDEAAPCRDAVRRPHRDHRHPRYRVMPYIDRSVRIEDGRLVA